MKLPHFVRYASALTGIAFLAACGGGSRLTPPAQMPAGFAGGIGAVSSGRPWMAPGAQQKDLLYVTLYGPNSVVQVYSYPALTLVGTLTGFQYPLGLCTNKAGDVWIVSQGTATIAEYAHGGTKPIANLRDPGVFPVSCAVDPTTGNLAVTNFGDAGGHGSVAIYKHARGAPVIYSDSRLYNGGFCGYDNKGNLFIDGFSAPSVGLLAELVKGGRKLNNITLNRMLYYPVAIQWDGKYLAIGDQRYNDSQTAAIYRTTGAGGKVVGTTVLAGTAGDVPGWWIDGKTVIGPDYGLSYVGFYRYPAGGAPLRKLAVTKPLGVVVSNATR